MRTNRKIVLVGVLFVSLSVSLGAAAQSRGSRSQNGGYVTFRVGQTVPAEMLTGDNVIKSYSHYHVRKAQDGYEWIHGDESNVLLVSMKSRIVSRIEYRPNISPESK